MERKFDTVKLQISWAINRCDWIKDGFGWEEKTEINGKHK